MAKKCLIMLILVTIVSGGVFAQTDVESDFDSDFASAVGSDFASKPKNTIVVDIGPLIVGLAFGGVGELLGGGEGLSSTGFGIGAQYERQILENLAIAGRFAYLGVGFGYADSFEESGATVNTSLGINLDTISVEAHVRYYPSGETFFLGGMLGFGTLSATFSGDLGVKDSTTGIQEQENISFTASRGYLKLGLRLGWRINFGRVGGFTFEPSLGYDFAIGLGDTLGTALNKEVAKEFGGEVEGFEAMDLAFWYLEQFIFVGGPRLTLAFGWRF